ncbi:MAG: hypothetical protein HKN33_09280 [Pyrinomonadaceae bacterium]|nr:hypothetical protein [Pyrinomonadaceae bacterium]
MNILRGIAGVIGGYIFVIAFIIGTFSAMYAVMGADTAYKPGSYEVSMTWVIPAFILGLIAAVGAGWLCFLIARSKIAVYVLACLFLVVGLASAVAQMSMERPSEPRAGDVSNAEAMAKSVSPTWFNFLNPFVGAIGVLVGGGLKKEE